MDTPEQRLLGQSPEPSLDGKFVLVQRRDADGNQDIWKIDVTRGTSTRLTTDPALDQFAVWSAKGTSVYFSGRRNGKPGIYEVSASGGPDRKVLEGVIWPVAVTPDGQLLLFEKRGGKTVTDIWALPLSGSGRPYPLIASDFEERSPAVSPDGRWLAYLSDVTGTNDVYVCRLEGGKAGPATRVSVSGGRAPRWRADGKELFFLAGPQNPEEELPSAVDVNSTGNSIEIGAPHLLFKMRMAPLVAILILRLRG